MKQEAESSGLEEDEEEEKKEEKGRRKTDGGCVFLERCSAAVTQQHSGTTVSAGSDVLLSEMLPLSVSHTKRFYYAHAAGRRQENAHLGVVTSEERGELFAKAGYC